MWTVTYWLFFFLDTVYILDAVHVVFTQIPADLHMTYTVL